MQFLCDVGLNYLSLNRATRTLSGGEAQRIGLANSLGSQLVDTLYVLDEPSIGLHPRDMDRLLRLLHRLRDARQHGARRRARPRRDPRRRLHGRARPGQRREGRAARLRRARCRASARVRSPAQYLTGARAIPAPDRAPPARPALDHAHRRARAQPQGRRRPDSARRGDRRDRRFGLGQEHARPRRAAPRARDAAARRASAPSSTSASASARSTRSPASTRSTTSSCIDQSPIGKSPRSNPVTYVKAFDEIRRIFADAPLARAAPLHAGHVQLQRRRRTLRDVRRRRLSRGRDGVHGRRVRAVRRLRRQALQARRCSR